MLVADPDQTKINVTAELRDSKKNSKEINYQEDIDYFPPGVTVSTIRHLQKVKKLPVIRGEACINKTDCRYISRQQMETKKNIQQTQNQHSINSDLPLSS